MNAVNTRPYHHGNLHEALLDEAQRLVLADGPDALTLRGVARAAGVSPSAAYRHFVDKSDLQRALGDRVLERQQARIEAALSSLAEDATAAQRIRGAGRGYLDFATGEPDLLRLLDSMDMSERGERTLAADPFGTLLGIVCEAIGDQVPRRDGRIAPDDPATALAIALWALVHGLAMMFSHGPLRELPTAQKDLLIESTLDHAAAMIRSAQE